MTAQADARFMRLALAEAERGRGRTSPNPLVGCLIVRGGKVLARGFHEKAGLAHAEVDALVKLGGRAPGATAYVTLEPCNHTGRTGPCTEALIKAGVVRVVVGTRDPNPAVAGGGARRLRRAGIAVELGVLEAECRAQNEAWITFATTGRPRVTLKAAVTLDGRLAARGGDSRWVTGEAARLEAHRMRDRADAILVGAGTVRADDPRLTARLPPPARGRDPLRVVLDGRLALSPRARVLPAMVVTTRQALAARPRVARVLAERGAEVVALPGRQGRVALGALLDALGRRGICSLLVEGGAEVHGGFLAAGLYDEVAIFVAPKLLGAGGVPLVALPGPTRVADAWRIEEPSVEQLGEDLLIRGRLGGRPRRRLPRG